MVSARSSLVDHVYGRLTSAMAGTHVIAVHRALRAASSVFCGVAMMGSCCIGARGENRPVGCVETSGQSICSTNARL